MERGKLYEARIVSIIKIESAEMSVAKVYMRDKNGMFFYRYYDCDEKGKYTGTDYSCVYCGNVYTPYNYPKGHEERCGKKHRALLTQVDVERDLAYAKRDGLVAYAMYESTRPKPSIKPRAFKAYKNACDEGDYESAGLIVRFMLKGYISNRCYPYEANYKKRNRIVCKAISYLLREDFELYKNDSEGEFAIYYR